VLDRDIIVAYWVTIFFFIFFPSLFLSLLLLFC